MTFLEESSTPSNGIIEISQVIVPIDVLDIIINIMDNFYNGLKEEKNINEEINDISNDYSNLNFDINENINNNSSNNEKIIIPQNKSNIEKKIKEDTTVIPEGEYSLYQNKFNNYELNNKSTINNINNTLQDNLGDDSSKKMYHFTPKMKKFFSKKFYNDDNFREDIRFQLANRMYQFFKFFGIIDEYKNPAVIKFYEKMSFYSEKNIIKNYYTSKKRISRNIHKQNKYLNNNPNINNNKKKENNKERIANITNPIFYDNYLCVAFFESITRMVFVKRPEIDKLICVLFTVNPVVTLLSAASKNEFLNTVDRSDRSSKLVSLMENCDYFFAEISYKQNQVKDNLIAKYIIDFDFYWLEIFSFIITIIINLILIITVDKNDLINNKFKYSTSVNVFGYFNFIFNFLVIFIWFIIKFPLYYLTESHKYLKELKNEKE